MSIWFFHGKEEFKISKEIGTLRAKLLDEAFSAINYRVLYSPDFPELLEVCSSAPLMFGNIMNVIHCENYFFKMKNKKIEFTDEQIKALDYALQNVSEANNIIFVCNVPRNEDKKPDTRTKLFKTIAKYSNVKDFPEYRSYDKELASYIIAMAKEKDLFADTKIANKIISQCGVNLRIIDSELEKIKVGIYPNKKISEKDILEFCTLQEDIFALADLVISNDKNAVLKQLEANLDKKHPLEILALIQANLHKLIYLKTYEREKSAAEMASKLKIGEYPVKLLLEKLRNHSVKNLADFKHRLTEAELKIKTGKTANPEYLFECVLLCGGGNV